MLERLIAKLHELSTKKAAPGGYTVTARDLLDLTEIAVDTAVELHKLKFPDPPRRKTK